MKDVFEEKIDFIPGYEGFLVGDVEWQMENEMRKLIIRNLDPIFSFISDLPVCV